MNCVYLWFIFFDNHHELEEIYIMNFKELFCLTWVFLNISEYSFSIIFRNVFCVISQRGIVRNCVFWFVYSSSSSEPNQSNIFSWIRTLIVGLRLVLRTFLSWILFFQIFWVIWKIGLHDTIYLLRCVFGLKADTISWVHVIILSHVIKVKCIRVN